MSDDAPFLRSLYRAFADRPLEPDDTWYVDLYTEALAQADPVEQLATGIEWAAMESVHLFSGFRGTGKSTELRRLRDRLQSTGSTKVVLCDMVEVLNLSMPIDIADFLIGVAGAFSDQLESDPDLLGADPTRERYWDRLVRLMTETNIDLDLQAGGGIGVASAGVKANIRQDPTFRERLRERMEGHLGALVNDVQAYLRDCVSELRSRHGDDTRVVLVLDSVEQIRGTTLRDAESVYASVESLFGNHSESLRFDDLHVVYSVPPWLKIRIPGIAGDYDTTQLLPCVRVRTRDGLPYVPGVDAMVAVVSRRGDWQRLLGSRAQLDRLILASGGYLRDLFRLLQSCLRQARGRALPIEGSVVDNALHEVRNSYLPLAAADAQWLHALTQSKQAELVQRAADGPQSLYQLSRFFDTHMVLAYRDGEDWYDVHPLLADEVARQCG